MGVDTGIITLEAPSSSGENELSQEEKRLFKLGKTLSDVISEFGGLFFCHDMRRNITLIERKNYPGTTKWIITLPSVERW